MKELREYVRHKHGPPFVYIISDFPLSKLFLRLGRPLAFCPILFHKGKLFL